MPSRGTLLSWATVKDGFCLDAQSVRDLPASHSVSTKVVYKIPPQEVRSYLPLRWLPRTPCQVRYPVEEQGIPRGMSVSPVPPILVPERVESEERASGTWKRLQSWLLQL